MRIRFSILTMLVGAYMSAPYSVNGQWVNHPTPGAPRTKDGKVNLSAPAPRVGGKPDLSGIWQAEPTPLAELTAMFGDIGALAVPGDDPRTFNKYLINILADYKPEESPMRPEFNELFGKRNQVLGLDIPTSHCLPGGVPFGMLLPFPTKIVQTPGLIVMLLEGDGTSRQVYTDGRKYPDDPQPMWMGYSVGRWEGDTLVVETRGINDKTWLDALGHPHSEDMRVTERFHRRDFGHMDVQITIDDPKTYTKPFSIKVTHRLLPDTDILEWYCAENEKDRKHL
jgi:hypothetical protein